MESAFLLAVIAALVVTCTVLVRDVQSLRQRIANHERRIISVEAICSDESVSREWTDDEVQSAFEKAGMMPKATEGIPR